MVFISKVKRWIYQSKESTTENITGVESIMSAFPKSPATTGQDLVVFEGKSGYCDPKDITINPHYRELLPRPTPKEYAIIKQSMIENGQQKPVEVDQDMIMVDGFTRLDVCIEIGKQVWFESRYYESKTAVLRQMAILNLHRRHITDYAKVLLYNEIYQDEKKLAKIRSEISLKIVNLKKKPEVPTQEVAELEEEIEKIGSGSAVDKFSKIINVSEATVKRSQYVAKFGDTQTKEKVKTKKMSLTNAYYKVREKIEKKKPPQDKMKSYMFTITPDNGSRWKTRRMLFPKQVVAIKAFILHLKV